MAVARHSVMSRGVTVCKNSIPTAKLQIPFQKTCRWEAGCKIADLLLPGKQTLQTVAFGAFISGWNKRSIFRKYSVS
jgi:hypothetical protein